jgi:outer membrane protein
MLDPAGARAATLAVLALASLLVLGLSARGDAQVASEGKLPPTVAAVIDYQRILRDARAARAVRDQVESRRRLYQEEIAKQEQRLHDVDKDLASQRSVLSPETFAARRAAFEGEVADVQRMAQERRRQLDQAAAAALNEVRSAMIQVVGELADTKGFNLVVPSSGLLLFSPQIDLTNEVMARLDTKLPNVKVPEKVD